MSIYTIDYVLPRLLQDIFDEDIRVIMVGDPLTKNNFDIKNYSKKYGVPILYIFDELYIPRKNLRISSLNNMSKIVEEAANKIISKLFAGEWANYSISLRYYDGKSSCDFKITESQSLLVSNKIGVENIIPFYRILLLPDKRRIYEIRYDEMKLFDPYYRIKEKFKKEVLNS